MGIDYRDGYALPRHVFASLGLGTERAEHTQFMNTFTL